MWWGPLLPPALDIGQLGHGILVVYSGVQMVCTAPGSECVAVHRAAAHSPATGALPGPRVQQSAVATDAGERLSLVPLILQDARCILPPQDASDVTQLRNYTAETDTRSVKQRCT